MSLNGTLDSSVQVLLKEAFKLNSYEANVYAALLARPMSPKEISRTSKVPLPRIYDTLAVLSQKGFVEEAVGRYNAVNPLSALDSRIAQFKSTFEKEQLAREEAKKRIVEALKPVYSKRIETTADPVLLKGINSIGSRFLEIMRNSRDVIFLVRKGIKIKETFKSYLEAVPLSRKRIRIIFPAGSDFTESDRTFSKRLGIEVRSWEHPILDMMVADQLDVMIGVPEPASDEPFGAVAVWVRNPSFGASTRKAVEEIWSISSLRGMSPK